MQTEKSPKSSQKEYLAAKTRILEEVGKPGIPDILLIFSPEYLPHLPQILKDLLAQERRDFRKLLKKPIDEVVFEDLYQYSLLDTLYRILEHYETVNSTPEIQSIVEGFQPLFIGFLDEVGYSREFYGIHLHLVKKSEIDAERRRILELEIESFERNGIHLDEERKKRLKVINKKLAKLSLMFSQNELSAENAFSYVFGSDESLKEMPADIMENAKRRAEEIGETGWRFASDDTSYLSVMQYCSDQGVRRHFYLSRNNLATSGKSDNRPLILKILKLRQERAEIIGYRNHAEYSLSNKMAPSPEAVIEQTRRLGEAGLKKGASDLQEIRDHFGLEAMHSWDVAYYGRKLKREKYDVDEQILRQYYELEKVLAGIFSIAHRFYGLVFEPIAVPCYDQELRIYRVHKEGRFLCYFIQDLFYRKEKKSGAWATIMRSKYHLQGKDRDPIIVNVTSYQKGPDGRTLLNPLEASTIFHEFGHALHKILNRFQYESLSGSYVEWDFIELPSQIMENWFTEPESKKTFAFHVDTGEPMPEPLIRKIEKLKKFMSGYSQTIDAQYTLVDMLLHTQEPPKTVKELDEKVVEIRKRYSLFDDISETRFHSTFTHIFDGAYAAGFYSYTWAEIIEADIFSEFKKNGIFDVRTAKRFEETILSQGCRKPATELFRDFMGRDVSIVAYLERNGFGGVSSYGEEYFGR